ncbi:MAG: SDR family oxidoreductase [Deltaproteobacteria bacterium]|nr:MAG: SDR family oxidoreductase [Deltaproteobacteria bacterium]
MSDVRFDGKVALVTGAGGGLGRSHALLLARRGAKVVVNDLGGSLTGEGQSSTPAEKVCEEIRSAGGEAVPNYDSVADYEAAQRIVGTALDTFGRIDIVINNAGILRDKSFAKMEEADFDAVIAVHLKGAFNVTKAAWPHFREQGYGRVIMTSSAAGLYGNFGQANYSAAKMGLVGLGQTLAQEGAKYNIHTNIIAPIARSRMTETIFPPELLEKIGPELVSPLVAWLCSEACEANGEIFEVGAGLITRNKWARTGPWMAEPGQELTIEAIRAAWEAIMDLSSVRVCPSIQDSLNQFVAHATGQSG